MSFKILAIFQKNIQTIFNSRLTSIILILGPIFLIMITGSALKDTSIKNAQLGIFLEEENEFTNNFLNKLRERSFSIDIKDSLDTCKQEVINSQTHGCLELRKVKVNIFNQSIQDKNFYDTILYVDFSKQRIVWGIIGSISGVIDEESHKLRKQAVESLNEDIDYFASSINSRENVLNRAILRTGILNDNLDKLKAESQEIESAKKEINKAQGEVTKLEQNLQNLKEEFYLDENVYFLSIIQNTNKIEESLTNTKQKLNEAEISRRISPIEVDAQTIENYLLDTKNELQKLKIDIENIKSLDVDRVVDPISLTYQSVSRAEEKRTIEERLGFLDYLFPSLIMFFVLLMSIILAATLTIKERVSNAYIRNITSKTFGSTFIISNFLTCFLIVLVQTSAIILVAAFFLKLSLLPNLITISLIVLIATTLFVVFGLLIGYIFDSQEAVIIASISVGLLFFIFSPIVTPVETLPNILARIVGLSPLVLLETRLRLGVIFEMPFRLSMPEIASLVLITMVSLLLLTSFYSISKKKEI